MSDLLQTGGAGGIGAVLGVILSFLGFKSRLDGMEKRVDSISQNVVYSDTCRAAMTGIEKLIETQTNLVAEMRDDVRELLKK